MKVNPLSSFFCIKELFTEYYHRSSKVPSEKPSTHGQIEKRLNTESPRRHRLPDNQCTRRTRLHICLTRFVFFFPFLKYIAREKEKKLIKMIYSWASIRSPIRTLTTLPFPYTVSYYYPPRMKPQGYIFVRSNSLFWLDSLYPPSRSNAWLLSIRRKDGQSETYQAGQFLFSAGSTGLL